METVFSLSEAKAKFSDIINRIIYKKEKIVITKKGKKVAVILPIDELKKYGDNGLIQAKGALADLDDSVDKMVGRIYESRKLEKQNIIEEIESVTVFTKIPKNSIKIPVAGGFTYSPDFAYVVKTKDNQILNFVIETKNVDRKGSLREEEKRKIQNAEVLFNKISESVKVNFKTQFADDLVCDLIRKIKGCTEAPT